MSKLPRAPALVWVALWRFERDGVTRIAVAALARLAGCGKRQAIRAIARLVADGLVEVVYRGGKDAGVSVYRVSPVSPARWHFVPVTGDTHVTYSIKNKYRVLVARGYRTKETLAASR